MDSIKGAQELCSLLKKRHGVIPEQIAPALLVDSAAPPIFHWLGIEPPPPTLGAEPLPARVGRRRRLARFASRTPWE